MQSWIIDFMNQFGYGGIIFLIAVENIFPPIPSEVILTFGGFMTTFTTMNVFGVIISATIGSLLGAIILYFIGRFLSHEKIERVLDGKIGKILRLNKDDVYKTYDWFNKKGKFTVFFCRCIPVIRSLISVPAGMSGMKFSVFLIFTILGSLIWNTILVLLGVIASDSWSKIVDGTDIFTKVSNSCNGINCSYCCIYILQKEKKKRSLKAVWSRMF